MPLTAAGGSSDKPEIAAPVAYAGVVSIWALPGPGLPTFGQRSSGC
ncbi:hypothetical protein ACWDYH_25365 [Nocardia goodfellowii]